MCSQSCGTYCKKTFCKSEYLRETIADQIQAEMKLPARLPIRTEIKKEIIPEQPVEVNRKLTQNCNL